MDAPRQDTLLDELAELSMAAARHIQQQLLASTDAEEIATLSLALNRTTRSVRQTLALGEKLHRARKQALRDDESDARRASERAVAHRKAQVRSPIHRLVWTEYEPDEAEALLDDLDDLLDEESLSDTFTAEPVDHHIERLKQQLGLPTPAHPGESRDPSRAADRPEPPWQSSA